MAVAQNGYRYMEVLMVWLQLGQGKTWTAVDRLKLDMMCLGGLMRG